MTMNHHQTDQVLNGLQLLVIEEEHDARTSMISMLQAYGADVVAAGSVDEGLAAVEAHHPDVLISDLKLPDGDGYTLMRTVRMHEAVNNIEQIPAIAVSASTKEIDLDRALSSGFKRYLAKPVRPERLISMIIGLTEQKG